MKVNLLPFNLLLYLNSRLKPRNNPPLPFSLPRFSLLSTSVRHSSSSHSLNNSNKPPHPPLNPLVSLSPKVYLLLLPSPHCPPKFPLNNPLLLRTCHSSPTKTSPHLRPAFLRTFLSNSPLKPPFTLSSSNNSNNSNTTNMLSMACLPTSTSPSPPSHLRLPLFRNNRMLAVIRPTSANLRPPISILPLLPYLHLKARMVPTAPSVSSSVTNSRTKTKVRTLVVSTAATTAMEMILGYVFRVLISSQGLIIPIEFL